MQNPYNNYLKRQKQQPMNNFKEKVKNSLSGKTINNTTLPNTAQSNIQSNVQQNARTVNPVKATTPVSTDVNKVGTGTLSGVSTPVETSTQVNTNQTTPNALETPLNASEVPSVASGTGMMSLSEINDALALPQNEVESPMARTVNPMARATTKPKYEQLLEDTKNQQLAQAEKDWQLQQDAFNKQQEALKQQFDQSKVDAENAYKESVEKLNEQRYNQMEELNASGTNRGIQYSPQQLGLENVANINHNKNLAEASKNRNELLNKLQIEMNNALAQLNMSIVNAQNEHNKNKLDINTNFNNTLMGWNRDDYTTESDRNWQEEQTKLDQQFQQNMQNSQNKWQSNENKLDREHDKAMAKTRGYSTYSGGGGGGYSGYNSYSRNYGGYARSGSNGYMQNYSDLDDEITQQAIDNKFKQLSTDVYNAVDTGGVYDLMERADIYSDSVAPMYDAYYGKNKTVSERLDNTRETALKHLVNKSVARSTNGAYNIGDTVYQHKAPLRQSYIDKVKKTQERTKNEVYQKHSKNAKTKFDSKNRANAESIHEKVMSSKSNNKTTNKSNSSKYSELNKKFGQKNVAHIKKQQEQAKKKQAKKQQNKAKKQEKAKKQQKKRIEVNKKLGAKNQAYIKKQMAEKKKQQEKAKKFKNKVKNAVKKIFKKK